MQRGYGLRGYAFVCIAITLLNKKVRRKTENTVIWIYLDEVAFVLAKAQYEIAVW